MTHHKLINNIKKNLLIQKGHDWFKSYGVFARLDRFCLVVELHCGESATNVATMSFCCCLLNKLASCEASSTSHGLSFCAECILFLQPEYCSPFWGAGPEWWGAGPE